MICFFKAVHFYGSLHTNQAPLLFRHSEVGGDPHIQKQNFTIPGENSLV